MSKVWAVASGEYSDYRVHGVFVTEEDAQAAIALGYGAGNYEKAFTEEMWLYEAGEKPEVHDRWIVSQRIGADGSPGEMSVRCERTAHDPTPLDEVEAHDYGHQFVASGFNREAAIKSVSDRIAKKRAEILGL